MNRWPKQKTLGVAVLALGALLTAISAGPAVAQIRAALVSDINNPARQPVRLSFTETLTDGFSQVSFGTTIYTVPAGKRLVLEHLYADAFAPSAQGVNVALLDPNYFFPIEQRHAVPFGLFMHQSSTTVRIYYDPGATVRVVTYRYPTTGSAEVTVRLNGHLVDLQ